MIKTASDSHHRLDDSSKKMTGNPQKSTASGDRLTAEIEKRTRAETVLRENENQFRSIVENFISGIFVADRDDRIIYLNKKTCEIFGYSRNEMIGRDFWRYLAGESKQIIPVLHKKHLTLENPEQPPRFNIIDKNGEKRCVEASATVINALTEKQQTIVQLLDITDQKRLTEKLHQIQKIEAISTLAGGIAHQFNNALSGIIGNIDLIEIFFADNRKLLRYTQRINACAQRMTQLTGQLLNYAKADQSQPEKLFLRDLIHDTLPLVKHAINPAVRIKTELTAEKIPITGDLAQLQMVLMAVIANASEAIADKGHIEITLKHKEITHVATTGLPDLEPGDYVRLSVTDSGKGMDENACKRIFDPFFTKRSLGRGLGMAAVYGIIQNHDGGITVESEPGRGTTVKIYLPSIPKCQVRQGHLTADETKSQARPEKPRGKRPAAILVVEDDENVMAVTQALLKKLNYRVLVARTGQEAIKFARTVETHIDLVMLDIGLPDMDGNAIYPLLMEARPDLKVIVCSGRSMDGPVQEILEAGAQDFIQKPFSLAKLSEKLEKTIQVL